jgi:hypothetical protein
MDAPQLGQRVQNTWNWSQGTVTMITESTKRVWEAGKVKVSRLEPLITVTWDGDVEEPSHMQLSEYKDRNWIREI